MNIKHNMYRVGAKIGVGVALVAPLVAFAEQKTLMSLIQLTVRYINTFVYLIIALSVLTFVYNVYNYFIKADPENKKDAGLYLLYSVIGFFVILSFWGLVNIVSGTLQLDNTSPVGGGSSSGGSSYGTTFGGISNTPPTTFGGVSNSPGTGSQQSGWWSAYPSTDSDSNNSAAYDDYYGTDSTIDQDIDNID